MVLAPAPLNLRLLAQRGREAHLQSVVSSYSAGGCIGAEEADRWFSEYLEFPCRLVHKPDDDPRLVDSAFAESWDQSTREQAPAVTSLCGSVFGRNLIHDALGTVRVGGLVETKQR